MSASATGATALPVVSHVPRLSVAPSRHGRAATTTALSWLISTAIPTCGCCGWPACGRSTSTFSTTRRCCGGLDQSVDHLLLFSPGSYATDSSWWRPWMTRWAPETARRYDTYRARLDAFPVCEEIAGPPQRLLWPGPVAPNDHMVLAVIPKSGPPRLLIDAFNEEARSRSSSLHSKGCSEPSHETQPTILRGGAP